MQFRLKAWSFAYAFATCNYTQKPSWHIPQTLPNVSVCRVYGRVSVLTRSIFLCDHIQISKFRSRMSQTLEIIFCFFFPVVQVRQFSFKSMIDCIPNCNLQKHIGNLMTKTLNPTERELLQCLLWCISSDSFYLSLWSYPRSRSFRSRMLQILENLFCFQQFKLGKSPLKGW